MKKNTKLLSKKCFFYLSNIHNDNFKGKCAFLKKLDNIKIKNYI